MDFCVNAAATSEIYTLAQPATPPISSLPAPSTIECPAVPGFATPTASDTCSTATLTYGESDVEANRVDLGRRWIVRKDCGNTATASQTITVADTTKPVISSLPAPSTL